MEDVLVAEQMENSSFGDPGRKKWKRLTVVAEVAVKDSQVCRIRRQRCLNALRFRKLGYLSFVFVLWRLQVFGEDL